MASVKLVDCVVEETAQYKALRAKVAAAVTSLNQEHPNPPGGIPFLVDLADPLVVHAPSVDLTAQVQQKNPGFGFGPPSAKPGFDFFPFQLPHTVDGVNTPALGMDVKLPKVTQMPQLDKMQEKVSLVNPGDPDPAGKLGSKMQPMTVAASPAAVAGAAQLNAPGQMQTMSGDLPPGTAPGIGAPKASLGAAAGNLSAAPGALNVPKGPDLGGMPAPAPTQGKAAAGGSGPAPPGGTAGAAKAIAAGTPGLAPSLPSRSGVPAPPPAAPPAVARLSATAEIRSAPRLTVAGKFPVVWGQAVTISEGDARSARNGICEVAVRHETQNAGTAATGSFGRRWTNRQNPVPVTEVYPPIPAGGSVQRTDTLPLKPGVNRLALALDYLNQVRETNDGNNVYPLTITVNGSCGLTPPATPGGSAPAVPGTRLPAVQQPRVPPIPVLPRPALLRR